MTRSTKAMLFLCVPVVGCAQPARTDREPLAEALLAEDRRPEVGLRTPGDDITEQVRAANVPGKEPPAPERRGMATPTGLRPAVQRVPDGFVATLPGARNVTSPAFHRGKVLAGGFGTHQIHAVDARTGKPAWSLELTDDGPTDPACKEGICVFNTFSCTLFSVDAETGRYLWSWYLGSPQLATPVIAGDIVYSSYPAGTAYYGYPYVIAAFDLKTGKPLWRRWIDGEVNSTPVAHGGQLYLATQVGTLYQFGAKDGEVVSVLKNQIASPPVITAEGVLFPHEEQQGDNDMLVASTPIFPALEAPSPQQRTRVRALPRPLVAQHRLLTVDNGVVVATHRKTGERLWQVRLDGDFPADIPAPMLQAGDSLLLATSRGKVLRMVPDTGEVLSEFSLSGRVAAAQPIAVDGWLYVGTTEGAMVAFDTGDSSLTGWEMLGGGPDRRGTLDPEGT